MEGTLIPDFHLKIIISQPIRALVSPTLTKAWETNPAFSSAIPLQSSLEHLQCTEILSLSELRHCRTKMSQKKNNKKNLTFPEDFSQLFFKTVQGLPMQVTVTAR